MVAFMSNKKIQESFYFYKVNIARFIYKQKPVYFISFLFLHLSVQYFCVMRHIFIYILLFSSVLCGFAQNHPTDYFQAPLDIPLILSGTFGELRNNHFHAGIDIKTQGASGHKFILLETGIFRESKYLLGVTGKHFTSILTDTLLYTPI